MHVLTPSCSQRNKCRPRLPKYTILPDNLQEGWEPLGGGIVEDWDLPAGSLGLSPANRDDGTGELGPPSLFLTIDWGGAWMD